MEQIMSSLMTRANETSRKLLDDDARWDAVKRRDHVTFHATWADAERAGFRPCKRCRPNQPARAEAHAALVANACRSIEEAEEAPSLAALAQAAGMSRFHFHRVFKAVTGVTPKAYAAAYRGKRVREEFASRNTVTEAIYGAGFNSN